MTALLFLSGLDMSCWSVVGCGDDGGESSWSSSSVAKGSFVTDVVIFLFAFKSLVEFPRVESTEAKFWFSARSLSLVV